MVQHGKYVRMFDYYFESQNFVPTEVPVEWPGKILTAPSSDGCVITDTCPKDHTYIIREFLLFLSFVLNIIEFCYFEHCRVFAVCTSVGSCFLTLSFAVLTTHEFYCAEWTNFFCICIISLHFKSTAEAKLWLAFFLNFILKCMNADRLLLS